MIEKMAFGELMGGGSMLPMYNACSGACVNEAAACDGNYEVESANRGDAATAAQKRLNPNDNS